MVIFFEKPKRQFSKMSYRLMTASAFALAISLVGIPGTSGIRLPLGSLVAIAQTSVTNEEIAQYAQSVLDMDSYRAEAYEEISQILLLVGTDINDIGITCSDMDEISRVPRSVRRDVEDILVSYCNQAQDIVTDNGLTPRRFNEITKAHSQDQRLYDRIQQELIRLQDAQ